MAVQIDPATGIGLRLERVARRLKVKEVAKAAGCSRQWIWIIEARDRPGPASVAKYLAALERAAQDR